MNINGKYEIIEMELWGKEYDTLTGRIYFHDGDDSSFIARKMIIRGNLR